MSVARIYRTGSPFNAVELAELSYEQSAQVMYLAHIDHPPGKLVRASHTDWTFSNLTFQPTNSAPTGVSIAATYPNTDSANSGAANDPKSYSYVVTSVDPNTGIESRASSTVSTTNSLNLARNYNTISWSAVAGMVYRVYKANDTSDFGYIGSTTQTSFKDDNIGPDFSDGPPQAENPFPGTNDYPSTVSFFQQRLLFARTNNHPNAIYGSRSGEYENMDVSRPLRDSDALSFALVAGKVNAVNEMLALGQSLLALTSDSIFAINGGQQGFLTPSNIVTQRETGRGSARLKPLLIDNIAFYHPAVGGGVRSIGYDFSFDGFNSNDVTIFSPHMFRGFKIVSWAYAAEPFSIIWAVREDGILLAFTWQQEQQVWGWSHCDLGGTVESVCSISENGEDRLYVSIVRGGVRYIERMASAFWSTVDDACFMDAAVTYQFDTATDTLINLQHLEGQSVVAVADGAVVDGLTVTGGKVTLPDAALRVTVGLPFTATIETLPLTMQAPGQGWTIASPQQASKIYLRVKDTRGIFAGPTTDKLNEVRARSNETYDEPPQLVTGIVEATMAPHIRSGDRGDAGVSVVVQSSDPLPFTLTEVLLSV